MLTATILESDYILSNNFGTTFIFNTFASYGLKFIGALALVLLLLLSALAGVEVCSKTRVIEEVVDTKSGANSLNTKKIYRFFSIHIKNGVNRMFIRFYASIIL
jgi:hypothetical protein